jgi:hypothetical protein
VIILYGSAFLKGSMGNKPTLQKSFNKLGKSINEFFKELAEIAKDDEELKNILYIIGKVIGVLLALIIIKIIISRDFVFIIIGVAIGMNIKIRYD